MPDRFRPLLPLLIFATAIAIMLIIKLITG
jgi:hypothetical protein